MSDDHERLATEIQGKKWAIFRYVRLGLEHLEFMANEKGTKRYNCKLIGIGVFGIYIILFDGRAKRRNNNED